MSRFPLVDVAGDARALGAGHGEAAREQIRGFLEYLAEGSEAPRSRMLAAAARFDPLFRRYAPELIPELEGLAAGAGIRWEEALLLQLRGEVIPLLADGCTSFGVVGRWTRAGEPLLGQTSDVDPEMRRFFLVLRLRPRQGPAVLMWTLAGQLGYHGVSSLGTAHFANNLGSGPVCHVGPGGAPRGLSHYPVKRLLFGCRSRREVEALWERIPVVSSGNYMACAGGELFDLEVTPHARAAAGNSTGGILVHANHFLAPELRSPATDAAALPDSHARQARLEELLAGDAGRLDVAHLRSALSDHRPDGRGICRHETAPPPGHPGPIQTAAALICEPEQGRLHVSYGHPCEEEWTTYQL